MSLYALLTTNIRRASLALLAGFASVHAGPNLLQNGEFEVDAPGLGLTTLTGWTVLSGTIDIVGTDYGNPVGGKYSFELTGTPGVATVETSFATTPAASYVFSGYMATHQGIAAWSTAKMQVTLTGLDPFEITHFAPWTGMNPNWSYFSVPFQATSSTTTLRLKDTTGVWDFGGVYLDNLSVNQVPDSGGTAALTVLSLAAIALRGSRRQQAGSNTASQVLIAGRDGNSL